MYMLNIAAYNECTEVEGPGKRFAIWCQGCLKRCKGCCNEHMQEIRLANIIECDDLLEKIRRSKVKNDIEGITLIGGEPFLQAKGLFYLSSKCKEIGLSIMAFTGYEMEELKNEKIEYVEELLKNVDILVAGEFIEELYDTERNWIGSKNQRIHYLSDFYKKGLEYRDTDKEIEIRLYHNEFKVNGWPYI